MAAEEDNANTQIEVVLGSDRSDDNYATTGELPAVLVTPGDVIAGKYEVEKIIGRGGMGIVVAARHVHLNERVALKLLLPSATQTREFRERFMREAQVTAKFRSEHIARVTDVGILDSGSPYMIMEYLDGQDLRQVMKNGGPLPVSIAVEYIVQACEGMAEAHSFGVVHRDLKPSNLFLTQRRDGSDLIKVLDFGISKAILREDVEASDLTSAGTLLGSPRYMSPEQLRDTALVDSRADVWSLASILYEMLGGKPPFADRTHAATCVRVLGNDPPLALTSRRPEVPEALQTAILQALERDPERRTADVASFATALLKATKQLVAPSVEVSVARIQGMIDATGSVRTNTTSGSHRLPSLSPSDASSRTNRTPEPWGTADVRPRAASPWPKIAVGGILLLLLVVAYQIWRQPTETVDAARSPQLPSATTTSAPLVAPVSAPSTPPADAPVPEASAGVKTDADVPAPTVARTAPRQYVPPPPRPTPTPEVTAPAPTKKKPGDILESRQ